MAEINFKYHDITFLTSPKENLDDFSIAQKEQILEIADENAIFDPLVETQKLSPIQYATFQGGGASGLAYFGALEKLEQENVLPQLKSVAGSSSGGIFATLIALGMSAEEIKETMKKIDLNSFLNEKNSDHGWMPQNLNMLIKYGNLVFDEKHGYSTGDVFLRLTENIIQKKLGIKNATFADLKKLQESNPSLHLKDLKLTGTNLSKKGELQIFDADNTPNVRIADALRVTMSFPGAFAAYPLKIGDFEHFFVDGGVANNFPIEIYDQVQYLPEGFSLTENGVNPASIGFILQSEDDQLRQFWNYQKKALSIRGLPDFLKAIYAGLRYTPALKTHAMQLIPIDPVNVKTLDFNIDPATIVKLAHSGYAATERWFKLYRESGAFSYKQYQFLEEKYKDRTYEEIITSGKILQKAYEILLYNIISTPNEPSTQQKQREKQILEELFFLKTRYHVNVVGPTALMLRDRTFPKLPSSPPEIEPLPFVDVPLPPREEEMETIDVPLLKAQSDHLVGLCYLNLSHVELLIAEHRQFSIYVDQKNLEFQRNIDCLQTLNKGIEQIFAAHLLPQVRLQKEIQETRLALVEYFQSQSLDTEQQRKLLADFDQSHEIITGKLFAGSELKQQIYKRTHDIREDINGTQAKLEENRSLHKETQQDIQELLLKRDQFNRELQACKTMTISIPALHQLRKLNNKLDAFVSKKSRGLTGLITRFADTFKISDKHLPANVRLLRQTRQLRDAIKTHEATLKDNRYDKDLLVTLFKNYMDVKKTQPMFEKKSKQELEKDLEEAYKEIKKSVFFSSPK